MNGCGSLTLYAKPLVNLERLITLRSDMCERIQCKEVVVQALSNKAGYVVSCIYIEHSSWLIADNIIVHNL